MNVHEYFKIFSHHFTTLAVNCTYLKYNSAGREDTRKHNYFNKTYQIFPDNNFQKLAKLAELKFISIT